MSRNITESSVAPCGPSAGHRRTVSAVAMLGGGFRKKASGGGFDQRPSEGGHDFDSAPAGNHGEITDDDIPF